MTKTQLKTHRDNLAACAFPRSPNVVLAALLGVQPRAVERWISGDRVLGPGRTAQIKLLLFVKKSISAKRWVKLTHEALNYAEEKHGGTFEG
jgi:hypothetical protein